MLTQINLSKLLKVSVRTIRKMVAEGKLPPQVGPNKGWTEETINEWIKNR